LKQGNTLLNVARLNAVESLGCVAMGRFFGGMCLNGVDGFFGRFEIVFGGKTTQSGSLKEVPVHFVLMYVCMFERFYVPITGSVCLCCWSNGAGVVVAMTSVEFTLKNRGGNRKMYLHVPGTRVCPELKINSSPGAMQLASKEYLFLVFQVSICV